MSCAKVLSSSRGPWTWSTPSLPTSGTSPIHLARLPGPESQSAYFVPFGVGGVSCTWSANRSCCWPCR